MLAHNGVPFLAKLSCAFDEDASRGARGFAGTGGYAASATACVLVERAGELGEERDAVVRQHSVP